MKRSLSKLSCLVLAGAASSLAPAQPASPVTPAAVPVKRAPVTGFKVTGNTLLPDADVQQTLAPFRGELTLADITRAGQALQDRYRKAGWGAVIVYVPEQSLAGGIAALTVLEGRIARVTVVGNVQFTEQNVRRALPLLKEGRAPQVMSIDAQIHFANENPARQLAVTIEPGRNDGEVDARVNVLESPVARWTAIADNNGTSPAGRARAGVGYGHANLWGLDHQLALQWLTSPRKPSEVNIVAASYRFPLYDSSTSIEAYGARSSVDGGTTGTAAGPLSFSGKGRLLGVRAMHSLPRRGEWDQRLIAALDQRDYLNACAIQGLPVGACGSAGESVTVTPLSLEYSTQLTGPVPASVQFGLSHNLALGGRFGDARNFEAVRPGASRRYTTARVSALAGTVLPKGWRAEARLNAQLSSGALIPGERFGLAGPTVVRGYVDRELIGDSGLAGSAEIHGPELADLWSARLKTLRLLAFVDAGRVSNRNGTPCFGTSARCTLAAVGVGLRAAAGGLQLRLDVAHTLKDAPLTQKGSTRLHLQATYTF
jgi:hemolysin activation/secretion protein